MSKRDNYIAKTQWQLDALNLALTGIESRAAAAATAERTDDAGDVAALATLRGHARAAAEERVTIQAAGAGSWHGGVAEMERLRHAFTGALHHFTARG